MQEQIQKSFLGGTKISTGDELNGVAKMLTILHNHNFSHSTVLSGEVISENAKTNYHLNWGTFQTVWRTLPWIYYKRSAGMPDSKALGGTSP